VASRATDHEANRAESAEDFSRRQADLFANGFSFSGYERDLVAWNRSDGSFLDISGVSGADAVGDGRGTVFADFDNDGDLDIFTTSMHGPAHHLYRNNVGKERGSLRISLRGTKSGRDAFGAEVRVKTSAGVQSKLLSGGSGFIAQSDPRLLFGLETDAKADWIEVRWPGGSVQRFQGQNAGSRILIVEGEPEVRVEREKIFNLPNRLSQEEMIWRRLGLERNRAVADIELIGLDGVERRLSTFAESGHGLILNLWATWCRNCAREMPELEKLHRRGVTVVGLSVDEEADRGKIPAFAERLGISYPVVVAAPGELQTLFATTDLGIPLSVVLDADLRPVLVVQGFDDSTAEILSASASGP
jgi:thiol-disulfide isomerase/thioredoxin